MHRVEADAAVRVGDQDPELGSFEVRHHSHRDAARVLGRVHRSQVAFAVRSTDRDFALLQGHDREPLGVAGLLAAAELVAGCADERAVLGSERDDLFFDDDARRRAGHLEVLVVKRKPVKLRRNRLHKSEPGAEHG